MGEIEKQVAKQIQALRQNLLDLTMRNRLLNFRPTKRRSVRIVEEIPREIYNILVLEERKMNFLATTKKEKSNFENPTEELKEISPNEKYDLKDLFKDTWERALDEVGLEKKHTDKYLQTSLKKEELQKKLFYIYQQSRSIFEEQGYSVLYLALGFLEWRESNSSIQKRYAPLILIPIELERPKVSSRFSVSWTGEDIFTNISLQHKLIEQGIELPEFEMVEDNNDLDKYFKKVRKAIKCMPEWNVIDEIYLGFFSFTKFVMYKDLDPLSWGDKDFFSNGKLFKSLFSPLEDMTSDGGFLESEVDSKLRIKDMHHVMDADPSQIAVIEDVKGGRNLVVQGPPGTGKSQTIVNMIGELLVSGKSVLFVSEKMAALEVVKRRLDAVGLGDFCFELHSRKSKRKEVLKELEKSMNQEPPQMISLDKKFRRLEKLRKDLNDYASALREVLGETGFSTYRLFSMREEVRNHFDKVDRKMIHIDIGNPEKISKKDFDSSKQILDDISLIIKPLVPLNKHPWYGTNIEMVLPLDQQLIKESIEVFQTDVEILEEESEAISDMLGLKKPKNRMEVLEIIESKNILMSYPNVSKETILNKDWTNTKISMRLIRLVRDYQKKVSSLQFNYSALDFDISQKLDEYKVLSSKRLRFINGKYRRLKKEFGEYHNDLPKKDDNILTDLEYLAKCQSLRRQIRELETKGSLLFGAYWTAENSDVPMLQKIAQWIVNFRSQISNGNFSERTIDYLTTNQSKELLNNRFKALSEAATRLISSRNKLGDKLILDCQIAFGFGEDEIPFKLWTSKAKVWSSNIDRIQEWADYIRRKIICARTKALPLLRQIETNSIAPEDVVPCFIGNFVDSLLKYSFKQSSTLANFNSTLHEKKIKEFSELDRQMIKWNRERLLFDIFSTRPKLYGGASPNSEVGIILGEINRKRRHMPIRKLISQTNNVLLKIKPCFMMSPLSVAQFLEPNTIDFDVIIFDEASQVKPEDALGALARGKQLVVMGDTRQLPPTSFFDHIVDSEDEEEDEIVLATSDVESILHLCRRSYPTKTLRWHYRSKHESLIEVSNHEFYDNSLLIYPSPDYETKDLGLKFVHLPGTIYDRGRSSLNREEAKKVAQYALNHFRNHPDKSLGIGTFNIKQQQAIQEEIEYALLKNPDLEESLTKIPEEPFFVKNLETIQGDERDVIVLSVGFGFDANKKLSRNFGPLNQDGGERRLNVLITRAREKCIVFSNFKSQNLHIDSDSPFGLRALKTFLQYAETRNLTQSYPKGRDSDSPFEDSVCELLRAEGHQVDTQVGCANYRIDMAVIDPENPGRYLLGIECDGATYHSSLVARERDRLRQQVLEKLGWHLYRIWSTDWYRNRKKSEIKLIEAIKNASENNDCITPQTIKKSQKPDNIPEDKLMSRNEEILSNGSEWNEFSDEVVDYTICSMSEVSTYEELHKTSQSDLSKAIIKIVKVEEPIHVDEVVKRIRNHWGLRRSGNRIQEKIYSAINFACRSGQITKKKDFLWTSLDRTPTVRRRQDDTTPKIDMIADEEIAEAIRIVLRHQFSTPIDELIVQSSRLFGTKSTSAQISERIEKVIKKMVRKKELQQNQNGRITLP